jgi:hypothetical protein
MKFGQRARDSKEGRQDKAARIAARHEKFGDNANNEANKQRYEDRHG